MGCTDDGAGKGCTPLCIAKVLAAGNLWQGQGGLLPFTCMNNIFQTYGCSDVRHEVNFHALAGQISMRSPGKFPCGSPGKFTASRRAQWLPTTPHLLTRALLCAPIAAVGKDPRP
jgi:hypothetical protein